LKSDSAGKKQKMTSDRFNETLLTLGLTQAGFARVVGINARTVRRWASGSSPVPEMVATLLLALELVQWLTDQETVHHLLNKCESPQP
jgi:DNA-binding transcriptional regulator YiaG